MSEALSERVWRALAHSPYGSIESLAQQLALPLIQVTAQLHALHAAGVPLEINSQTYVCLVPPQPLLAPARVWLGVSECAYSLDSTQTRARQLRSSSAAATGLVLAEQQTAGRGRAGRSWSSPLGAHLYLTCWWTFTRPLAQMGGLSLLVGIALRRTLHLLGVDSQLKWPNDVLVHGRKLAGILIELVEHSTGCVALIGVGLNHRMPAAFAPDQPWIDLVAMGPSAPSRQQVLETLLDSLADVLEQFDLYGFARFAAEFNQHHALTGNSLVLADTDEHAQVRGVDEFGQLNVRTASEALQFNAGEIALSRAQLAVSWRLLIDCGNSRLKWAWSPLAGSATLLAGAPVALRDSADEPRPRDEIWVDLQHALAQMQIETMPAEIVLASSFGGDRLALQKLLQQRFETVLRLVQSPARMGNWQNAYPDPATLGVDRALAMWAVLPQLELTQRVLLVSLGTAMTLDVLDGQGRHHGGLIAAAPALQRRALAALSARLLVTPDADQVVPVAMRSSQAVASASVWMTVALIEKVAREQQVDAVWLSGGALLDVLPWLNLHVPLHVRADLALRGLALT